MIGQRRLCVVFGVGLSLPTSTICELLLKIWAHRQLLASYEIEIMVTNFVILHLIWSLGSLL